MTPEVRRRPWLRTSLFAGPLAIAAAVAWLTRHKVVDCPSYEPACWLDRWLPPEAPDCVVFDRWRQQAVMRAGR